MINSFLRIITWNANGLNERALELEIFLRLHNIDIALISETHFTHKNFLKMKGYDIHCTNHPSERARGGSAIIVKNNIKYNLHENIVEDHVQATIISTQFNNTDVNIAATYFPPDHKPTEPQFIKILKHLGHKFIIGGDFNTKLTAWGSRLISPGKGASLLNAIKKENCNYHSARRPTYWPTDPNKKPDLLDFFISKGIATNNIEAENIIDLTSDHTPVLLQLNTSIILKTKKHNLTNKLTNWEVFREILENTIDLKVSLKTVEELDQQSENFITILQDAAKQSTPEAKAKPICENNYPAKIRELIKERRKARRIWQRSRNLIDKTYFNIISNKASKAIKEFKSDCLDNYLKDLGPGGDKNYSLWKATRRFNRPSTQIPPIKHRLGNWIRNDTEKVEYFADHLAKVFQPHEDIVSNVDTTPTYQPQMQFKRFTAYEIATEIDKRLNPKKTPGVDEIAPSVLKELPRKAIYMITYIFNACLRLSYIPKCFKTAQVIMITKPDKPPEEVTSYRPISLLPTLSKIFEKLLLKRLKALVKIPDFQFGFRDKHSAIEQIHRVTRKIENA